MHLHISAECTLIVDGCKGKPYFVKTHRKDSFHEHLLVLIKNKKYDSDREVTVFYIDHGVHIIHLRNILEEPEEWPNKNYKH